MREVKNKYEVCSFQQSVFVCAERTDKQSFPSAPHCIAVSFEHTGGNRREGVRLPRTTQVYVQSSSASQLSAHTTNPRLSSCYFKHTVGKRSKHCQYSLDNENQEVIRRGRDEGEGVGGGQYAGNVWKHWEQRSRRTAPLA